jgi:hypothetical protein
MVVQEVCENANELESLAKIIVTKAFQNLEKIEAVIKGFPSKKSPGLNRFPMGFYQTLKTELPQIPLKTNALL